MNENEENKETGVLKERRAWRIARYLCEIYTLLYYSAAIINVRTKELSCMLT